MIVGILASLSLLSYSKAVRKAKLTEAKIALKRMWECNDMFYNEHGYYYGPVYDIGNSGLSEIGFSPLSGNPLFIYSIEINSPPIYIAEPLRKEFGGDGSISGYELQIDFKGKLYIFEPGINNVSGMERITPTGGRRGFSPGGG